MGKNSFSEGMCFGFRFRSAIELSCLRSGSGPDVNVVAQEVAAAVGKPLTEWPELIGKRAYAAVFQNGDYRYQVTVGRMGRFDVEVDTWTIKADFATELPRSSKEGLLLATPAALCITARGDLALHAGSVDVDGVAVLLAATGSGGKTTLTAAFHRAGYRALADDLTCCGSSPPSVYPGPALLRLREDSTESLGITEAQATSTRAGKVHYLIDEKRRGTGTPIPLGAIVFLEWSTDPLPKLEPLDPHKAVARLWPLSFFLPGDDERGRCFEHLVDLTQTVGAWVLQRPKDFGQLPAVVELIAGRSRGAVV